jgi:hypothetical protein
VKPINLIPLSNGAGPMEPGLVVLEHLAATLARTFHTPCRIRPETFDVSFALDEGRHQYYSTSILQRLERASDLDARTLGVTACDLYVPVLTLCLGGADGSCAGVSTARHRRSSRDAEARTASRPPGEEAATSWDTPSGCALADNGA